VSEDQGRSKARVAGVGTLVAAWTFFDGIILGLPILLVAFAWDRPVIVFVVGALLWILANVAVCRWIDREWDSWIVGTSFETRLEAFRNGKRARRPVELVTRGSPFWFGLAAILTSAGEVVALHRLVVGGSATRGQELAAALAPALFWAALFSVAGAFFADVVG
jgi:hypothetical protein